MNKFINAINYLKNDKWHFIDSLVLNLGHFIPDEIYLKLRFRAKMGYWPNLREPRDFFEKVNWLKLHDRKPEYTTMVDKYAVKDYVSKIIGNQYIIPTIGVWDNVDSIHWENLPDKFVLKTTQGGGSGGVFICKDKNSFDKDKAIKKLNKSAKEDVYKIYRESPYKNVPYRIIAEEYVAPADGFEDLSDYKFFCFSGEPTYCQVIRNRSIKESIDFYDMEWNHMPFVGLNPKCTNGEIPVLKPSQLEEMIELCRKLSSNIPFVRVDMYVVGDRVLFGEMTFYPASGMGRFEPANWALELGDKIILPEL